MTAHSSVVSAKSSPVPINININANSGRGASRVSKRDGVGASSAGIGSLGSYLPSPESLPQRYRSYSGGVDGPKEDKLNPHKLATGYIPRILSGEKALSTKEIAIQLDAICPSFQRQDKRSKHRLLTRALKMYPSKFTKHTWGKYSLGPAGSSSVPGSVSRQNTSSPFILSPESHVAGVLLQDDEEMSDLDIEDFDDDDDEGEDEDTSSMDGSTDEEDWSKQDPLELRARSSFSHSFKSFKSFSELVHPPRQTHTPNTPQDVNVANILLEMGSPS